MESWRINVKFHGEQNIKTWDTIWSHTCMIHLSCPTLTDFKYTDRRHETPRWETKTLFTQIAWALCLHPRSMRVMWRGPGGCYTCSRQCLTQLRKLEAREPESFILGRKHIWLLCQRRTGLLLHWVENELATYSRGRHYLYLEAVYCTNILNITVWDRGPTYRTCRNAGDPWKVATKNTQ